jgi:ribonucleoside-triphosphate reductase (thioredoxin)
MLISMRRFRHETVARVVNGTYNMQKQWIEQHSLGWDKYKAQQSAQKMYDKIFTMKFLPPGRGLWAMGSRITEERGIYAALNNCAFVSTANMWDPTGGQTPSKPFAFLMDASMLGYPDLLYQTHTHGHKLSTD